VEKLPVCKLKAFIGYCRYAHKRNNAKGCLNMNNKAIATEKAPAAIGPYSQAVQAEGVSINVSGQLPIDPATGEFPSECIKDQTRQSLTNMKNILEAAGTDMAHVVETTVLLADIADFGPMNEVYAEFFSEPYPARAAFAVAALPKGAKVEIKAVARI
jgi:2-iminobutanoate/2-iminopropanoate deaminase